MYARARQFCRTTAYGCRRCGTPCNGRALKRIS